MAYNYPHQLYLAHHGILGQKWGVRRYQNEDGSLTRAGERRYNSSNVARNYQNRINDLQIAVGRHQMDSLQNLYKLKENPSDKEAVKAVDRATNYMKKGQEEINKWIDKAELEGYSIKSKEVRIALMVGKQYFDMVTDDKNLQRVFGREVIWSSYGPTYNTYATGYKVKVKKSKNKT